MSLKPDPWEASAACAHSDPEVFFHDPREHEPLRQYDTSPTKVAKRMCKGDQERRIPPCPVAAHCLKKALELDIRFGIWGGLSNRERQKLKKAMRRR